MKISEKLKYAENKLAIKTIFGLQSELDVERFLFFLLAEERDIDMIMGYESISYQDYNRILYIIHTLGFLNYYYYISRRFYPLFLEQILDVEKQVPNIIDELSKHDRWLDDFISNIPYDRLREHVTWLIEKNLFS